MEEFYNMLNQKRLTRQLEETEEEIKNVERRIKQHKTENDSFFFVITDLLLKQLYEKKNHYQYQLSLLNT